MTREITEGGLPAAELPADVRALAERLAERLDELMGGWLLRGTNVRVELQFGGDGRLFSVIPSPRLRAGSLPRGAP